MRATTTRRLPGKPGAKGFVTFLEEQLRYELKNLGQPRPTLWQDLRRVEHGEQFWPVTEKAVVASALLVVVLSRNWLVRPWCQREIQAFEQRWGGTGDEAKEAIKRRIVVVAKHHIEPNDVMRSTLSSI